jgi:hypothetical protein
MKLLSVIVIAGAMIVPSFPAGASSIGGGINYWHAMEDIDLNEFDQDGASLFFSLRSGGGLLRWEADFEIMPEGFMASPEAAYAPQVYLVVGRKVTAAVGAGWYYSNGEWADQPFYILRAGLEVMLLPKLSLDLMMNYRFTDWGELEGEDIDTDTIMLGAALRISI